MSEIKESSPRTEEVKLYQLEVDGHTVTCQGDPDCHATEKYVPDAIRSCIYEVSKKHGTKKEERHYQCHGEVTGSADLVTHRLLVQGGSM